MDGDYKSYFRVDDSGIYGFFEDYRFLSNFDPSRIEYEGEAYASVEHAYQAAKTTELKERKPFTISGGLTAGAVKKRGRLLPLIWPDWDDRKYSVMLELVFQKFLKHPNLQAKLVATGGRYLEETNHWGDNTWGVDYRSDIGKNWLGMILMDVRKCFKSLDHVKKKFDKY